MPSDNLLSRNNSIDCWLGSHALVNELGALRLSVERAQGLGMGSSSSPFPALPEYLPCGVTLTDSGLGREMIKTQALPF